MGWRRENAYICTLDMSADREGGYVPTQSTCTLHYLEYIRRQDMGRNACVARSIAEMDRPLVSSLRLCDGGPVIRTSESNRSTHQRPRLCAKCAAVLPHDRFRGDDRLEPSCSSPPRRPTSFPGVGTARWKEKRREKRKQGHV